MRHDPLSSAVPNICNTSETFLKFLGGHLLVGPSAAAWRGQTLKYARPRHLPSPIHLPFHTARAPQAPRAVDVLCWRALAYSYSQLDCSALSPHTLMVSRSDSRAYTSAHRPGSGRARADTQHIALNDTLPEARAASTVPVSHAISHVEQHRVRIPSGGAYRRPPTGLACGI